MFKNQDDKKNITQEKDHMNNCQFKKQKQNHLPSITA